MNDTTQLPDFANIADKFKIEEGETLEEKYIEFLDLLRHGRYRLDEIADGLGISGVEAEYLVQIAEQNGDVTRDNYSWMGLYTIFLTEKGRMKLPDLTGFQQVLSNYDITERDWNVLSILENHKSSTAQTILEAYPKSIAPVKLIPSVNHLVRLNYCNESGLWRRELTLTNNGKTTIKEIRSQS